MNSVRSAPQTRRLVVLGSGLVLVILLRLLVGIDPVSGSVSLEWPEAAWASFRMSAAVVAVLVGASLSLSGLLLQASLRNPLAAPSVLGVSSGAGLGVMLALLIAHQVGLDSVPWFAPAIAGALIAVGIVLVLGRRDGWPDPVSTILAGVIVATMAGAGMVLLQSMVPNEFRGRFLSWAMGTIPEITPTNHMLVLLVLVAGGAVWAMMNIGRLDALRLDEASARTIGARPEHMRLVCLILAGVLTAMTVAICGPLGFVGLLGPHMARLVVGPGHRTLVPATLIMGALVLVSADVVRQTVNMGAGRLPVGVVTTLVGGPFFLWLLTTSRGSEWSGGTHASM
jgi:iron complex transport system permease protein